ncbi:MAG: glycoside hydrolase family 172 protein [Limisphaerales bacterium]
MTPGATKVVNALWLENPLDVQFKSTNRVVVANIQGPAQITMMHFALPQTKTLNRDVLLRIYWDGETNPSVDCPLVDFFCDPNGSQDSVNSALVIVRRGFNCYFPMPFRKSAKIELDYDGAVKPGPELWKIMPCYSYVCYRTLTKVPRKTGYFCASWKQEALKLGLKDYIALEAKGKGKFVGWNVTVRQPGRDHPPGDENEKFYIDGETNASIEFQGLEDSFGFSWGFPPTANMALWMGYFPFMRGDAGYRFFVPDPINFEKSLKVAIGFGKHDAPGWRRAYSKFGSSVQFSSTVYWYQIEPHTPLPPMPPAAERAPAPEKLFWPEAVKMPSAAMKPRQDKN